MRIRTVLSAGILGLAALAAAQTADLKPGDNLVVEGVPPIPISLAEEVRPYAEVRAAIFTSWNPGRHEMLIATRFGNTYQAHLVKAPGAARTQLTFYPDRVFGGLYEQEDRATPSSSRRTGAATSSTSSTASTLPTVRSRC